MRSRDFSAVLVVVLALAAAPAYADPAQQVATAPSEKTVFEICRIPGAGTGDPDGTIEVPMGSEFEQEMPVVATSAAARGPSTPPVAVVTAQAVSIPADRYCVSVPVTPLGGTDDRALDAAVGDMFVPTGNRQKPLNFDPLGLTYGFLKSKVS